MLQTAGDFIRSALRLINVLGAGDEPTNDEMTDALNVLNGMADSWTAESLMLFADQQVVFNAQAGKQSYKYGAGAPDFNSPRPSQIKSAFVVWNANAQTPTELEIEYTNNPQKWAEISVHGTQSSLPKLVWDDDGFPYRTMSYYPIPSLATVQLGFYLPVLIGQFADAITNYIFPPSYSDAIRYNLAVRLAPEFNDANLSAVVVQLAQQTKGIVKSANSKILEARCDRALLGGPGKTIFNWLNGESK